MVGEPALRHVNELVIALGISWQNEESRVNQIANGVAHNPLHHFAIAELQSHPYALNDRRPSMKIEGLVPRIPIESVHIEDGLSILD